MSIAAGWNRRDANKGFLSVVHFCLRGEISSLCFSLPFGGCTCWNGGSSLIFALRDGSKCAQGERLWSKDADV